MKAVSRKRFSFNSLVKPFSSNFWALYVSEWELFVCYSLLLHFWFVVDISLNLEHLYFLEMSRVEQDCHTSSTGAISELENGFLVFFFP